MPSLYQRSKPVVDEEGGNVTPRRFPATSLLGLKIYIIMWLVIYSEELHLKSKQEPRFWRSRRRSHPKHIPRSLNRAHALIFFHKLSGPCGPAREVGVEGMSWIGPS